MTEDQTEKVFAELAKLSRRTTKTEASLGEVRQELAETRADLRRANRTWDEVQVDLRQLIAKTQEDFRAELREKLAENRRQARAETRTQSEETRRHFEIVAESLRSDLRLVAEGLDALREDLGGKIEATRREAAAGIAEVKSLLRLSYRDLDRRVVRLEETAQV